MCIRDRAYIENMYGFYEYGMWLVFSRETGKLIGRAGLEHDEMGYMIAPEFQNQGYATEVCRFIIDYARENTDFEELYCRIDERNEASVRLAKKLGFTNSGHMDDDIHASIYRKNIKNIKNNEKSAGKQMGLTTATELLEISLDNISHHRALDDSIIAYECFKNLYSYPILLSHIQKFNDEFYRKLTFKNTILCDLNNPLIDKKEMYFTCPCGYRAKRKKPWKFSCKSFIAPFACKHCGNTFMGRCLLYTSPSPRD